MLKLNRRNRSFKRVDASSLGDAHLLERGDLQDSIFNSSDDFFAEIGERVFVIGKEVVPSETVSDRIDLLGIDAEGTAVIVELKRGSSKLQMLQAISYAGMLSRWSPKDFQALLSEAVWEQLSDFLEVDVDELNRRQRLLLVAEGFDYALLAGAEWLSEKHGVDIRCASVSLAVDRETNSEYLVCTSIYPPPVLAEQAAARKGSQKPRPLKWSSWEEALSKVENVALREFAREEIQSGRKHYLRRRGLHYVIDGKRRWTLYCRKPHAYVWQRGRFEEDVRFWVSRVSNPDSVKQVKAGRALSFTLTNPEDLHGFREAATSTLEHVQWADVGEAGAGVDDFDES